MHRIFENETNKILEQNMKNLELCTISELMMKDDKFVTFPNNKAFQFKLLIGL